MIVTYQGIDGASPVAAQVRDWAAELDAICDRIARCDVVVQALPGRLERRPRRFRVRLAIAVPGGELVVHHDPAPDEVLEDPSPALRDSFEAARRRLEQYVWRGGCG